MRILFQGDSVTCWYRGDDPNNLGCGYADMVAGELAFHEPMKHEFFNRGIGGDRVTYIYSRAKTDIWDIKPDLMSLLVGVNDGMHEITVNNGVSAKRYDKVYRALLDETFEELPDLKVFLMGSFILKGEKTEEHFDEINYEVRKRAEIAEKIASDYKLPFVSLQDKFDKALEIAPENYWVIDGVHPTYSGHRLIADEWIKVFNKNFK